MRETDPIRIAIRKAILWGRGSSGTIDNLDRSVDAILEALQPLLAEVHGSTLMSDLSHYKAVYADWPGGEPCVIEGCLLTQQEHHRLAYGWLAELKELREFHRNHAHLAEQPPEETA